MTTATFETDTDKLRALALALLVHLFAVGALFVGLLWQREQPPVAAAEGEIEATLVTSPQAARAASKAVHDAKQAAPQPIPEPSPQTAQIAPQPKPQQALDQPDKIDQERVSALALQAAAQEKKEQEEKHRQEQVLLQQQAQVEAENKQRLAALAVIQSERAKNERIAKLAEEKLKQLRDANAHLTDSAVQAPVGPVHPAAGNKGDDLASLRAEYLAKIRAKATDNWVHHEEVPKLVHCHILFTQMIGGDVTDISYQNCPFDAAARATIERAMHKEAMPYTGYEKVFSRFVNLDFCYPEEACAK
jgi:colicin import membrane protein